MTGFGQVQVAWVLVGVILVSRVGRPLVTTQLPVLLSLIGSLRDPGRTLPTRALTTNEALTVLRAQINKNVI